MEKIYCKAGSVELTEKEAFRIYEEKKYIVTSTAIYQPHFSQPQSAVYFSKVFTVKGMARRGRFYTLTAAQINRILGEELLIEEL